MLLYHPEKKKKGKTSFLFVTHCVDLIMLLFSGNVLLEDVAFVEKQYPVHVRVTFMKY